MPRLSKRYAFIALAVGGLGALGAAVLPRGEELRPLWDDLSIAVQRPLYDDQRRLLSVHLPGFFPVKLTCLFQPAKGEWRTVLPGETVQGFREGGHLTCSNGDKFYLHANTTLRLWSRRGSQAYLEVERGWVSGVAAKQPVRLGLGNADVDIRPRTPTRFLATAHGRDETYLKCLSGHAQLALSRRVDEPLLLESSGCRLDVQRPGEAERFTMASGERTYVADLSLSFSARPAVPPVKRAAKPEAEIQGANEDNFIGLKLAPSADGKRRFLASSAKPQEDCGLFAYRPGHEPVELQPFPLLDKQFSGDIPPSARPPLFVACKLGDTLHASNFLGSLKPEVAPAALPAAAPAVVNAPAPASTAPVPAPTVAKVKSAAKLAPTKTKK